MAERKGVAEELASAALRSAWGFRIELTALAVLGGAWAALRLAADVGGLLASVAVAVPAAGLVAWPAFRRFAWRQLRVASIRRRFTAGMTAAGFDPDVEGTPVVLRVAETAAGYALWVRVPPGLVGGAIGEGGRDRRGGDGGRRPAGDPGPGQRGALYRCRGPT